MSYEIEVHDTKNDGPAGVRAEGLGKRFGDLWALRGLDLDVPARNGRQPKPYQLTAITDVSALRGNQITEPHKAMNLLVANEVPSQLPQL
jgi:hypothetical protein